jgi:hypothetical protein
VFDLSQIRALAEDEDAKHTRVWGDYTNGVITLGEARAALNYEVKPEHENMFSPKAGASQPNTDDMPEGKSEIKSTKVPSKKEVDEAVKWYEEAAPDEAKDLINATVKKSNGDSELVT